MITMKNPRWLTISMALTLAVIMIWAVPTLAQGRGKMGQGQGCGQGAGQGAGNTTCPAYPAYQGAQGGQGSQGTWCDNPQGNTGRRGQRGGGRAYQPLTQVPPATQ
jgi:hypothetical protein